MAFNIAPFLIEPVDDGEERYRYRAKWEEVVKEIKRYCKQKKREVPPYVDVRAAGYWFGELGVKWNGDTINAYMEDSEESAWIVEWNTR